MPIIGFKKVFKHLKGVEKDIFTINFDLQYTEIGSLAVKNESQTYFDMGDYDINLDELTEKLTEEVFESYDNGVYILSICKYIVDNVPNLYSINYESKGVVDTYFKQDIIDDYNKILNYKDRGGVDTITICGSLRFKEKILEVAEKMELLGNCILTPIISSRSNKDDFTSEEIEMLGRMHKEKIKKSDAILVVDVDGYIGKTTKQEIEYASSLGKEVMYYSDMKDIFED